VLGLHGCACPLAQHLALDLGSSNGRMVVFTVLTVSQLGLLLTLRSDHESFLSRVLPPNRFLLGTMVLLLGGCGSAQR